MTRYLVKTVAVATPENKNFAGLTDICYIGKEGRTLKKEGTCPDYLHSGYDSLCLWTLGEYGYTRKSDAMRCYSYRHPQVDEKWVTTAEIVEVTI